MLPFCMPSGCYSSPFSHQHLKGLSHCCLVQFVNKGNCASFFALELEKFEEIYLLSSAIKLYKQQK